MRLLATIFCPPHPSLQPLLVLAMLAVLRTGRLIGLELSNCCAGPLFAALMRFSQQLLELRISGNGAAVQWHGWGAAALLPKLRQLRLDYYEDGRQWDYCRCSCLPSNMPTLLAHACHLSSLELAVVYSEAVVAVCQALPALRLLR